LASLTDSIFARGVSVRVYGRAAIVLGLVGMVWGDVATRLATVLLTGMFIVFGIFVHASLANADPHSHFNWAENAINLALVASAWVIAASYTEPARPR
jgi:hypothetical protein